MSETSPPPAPTLTAPPTGNPLAQAWLVLVLAVLFGGGLAATHIWLSPIIAANLENETHAQLPLLIGSTPAEVREERLRERRVLRALDAAGTTLGWVIPAGGSGFADRIEVLIGVDARAERITGLYVLDQKETPGLGDWITDAAWLKHFTGPISLPLQVVTGTPDEGQVPIITGATISSESVVDIVNAALTELREALAEDADVAPDLPQETKP